MATCTIDDCTRTVRCRGWCGFHYQRWRLNGDPLANVRSRAKPEPRRCSIDGCDQDYWARGWCAAHYQRWRDAGDPLAPPRRARDGEGYRGINNYGYVVLKCRGVTILEHRKVMEEKLGRAMLPGETVHHMNGIKTDNDPGNLELWVSTRSGQRVTDLIAFVVEHYRAEVESALNT